MAEYVKAVSARERAWASQNARPREYELLTFKSNGTVDPQELLVLLDWYDALILPLMAVEPTTSVLRHPDLRLLNLFIHPDDKNIVSIIDWQETDAQPFVYPSEMIPA
jgi:aminoglycoside phosphotransferase (APT) family kinase protein